MRNDGRGLLMITWLAVAGIVAMGATRLAAQESSTAVPTPAESNAPRDQQRDQPSAEPNGERSGNNQPQTVNQQLQTLKRQLGREEYKGPPVPIRDQDHQMEVRVRSYIELRERNIVMQRRDYSCGAATLATIARYYWGDDVTEDQVLGALDDLLTEDEIADRIENGLAMSDLRRAAVKLGYQAVVGKLTFAKLQDAKVPVIVGIEPEGHKHFVVYRGVDGDWVYVADPIRGNIRIPIWEFRKQWQQNAVLAIHKPGQKVKETSPLSLRDSDTKRGDLNWYLIRTQPMRMPPNKKGLPQ
jgi:uncharacterized protein